MDIYFCDQTVHAMVFEALHFEDSSGIEIPELSPASVLSCIGKNERYARRQQYHYIGRLVKLQINQDNVAEKKIIWRSTFTKKLVQSVVQNMITYFYPVQSFFGCIYSINNERHMFTILLCYMPLLQMHHQIIRTLQRTQI